MSEHDCHCDLLTQERDTARAERDEQMQMKRENAAAAEACYRERDAARADADRLYVALERIHAQAQGHVNCAPCFVLDAIAAHRGSGEARDDV